MWRRRFASPQMHQIFVIWLRGSRLGRGFCSYLRRRWQRRVTWIRKGFILAPTAARGAPMRPRRVAPPPSLICSVICYKWQIMAQTSSEHHHIYRLAKAQIIIPDKGPPFLICHVETHQYPCVCVSECVYPCVCVCMCINVFVCVCVPLHRFIMTSPRTPLNSRALISDGS